ncbi:hypothetical protein M9H77_35507 [Catharanthus roseus]|uniref:Uncharacterized protein n=1 Tax=Catharanthus roseus TaxID=4058 RepID=A0ACB9ZTG1_CATRO|nr:hypothetical protein M9H77_35507 [Catharanthus roseus]
MGVRLFGNRALIWCLAGFDYEMLELDSNDLVLGSGLCLWIPTVALHICLNLGVETALMCLDSLRLLSCAQNLHVAFTLMFYISCFLLRLTREIQRHGMPLKFWAWSFGSIFPWKDMIVFVFWDL